MFSSDPQDLLDRARSGDGRARERLLEECVPYLRVLAQRQLHGPLRARVDPTDVVQQTCLEAHRDLGQFRGSVTDEFLAWLRRILRNNVAGLVQHHVLAERRSVGRERSLDDTGGETRPPRARLRSDVTSPSQRAMRGEDAVRLAQALTRLPDDQREAVRLRHLEGWTLSDMATWFGRSEVAVAGLLKRGLKQLRNQLPAPSPPPRSAREGEA